jgi:hypothetical protein
MATYSRRQEPPQFSDPRQYKWYLRLDFGYRCAYCTIHEAESGGHENFEVDHFRPEWLFPDLRTDYRNLYYADRPCNKYKRGFWPSPAEERRGERFVDPCRENLEDHWEEGPNGELIERTPAGGYTIRHIHLNRPQLLSLRRARRQAEDDFREEMSSLEAQLQKLSACLAVENLDDESRQELDAIYAGLQKRQHRLVARYEARWTPPYDMPPP